MGFLGDILRNRDRRKLEDAATRKPSPEGLRQLVKLYQDEGNLTRARSMAQRAVRLFPRSEIVQSLDRQTRQAESSAKREHLRRQIENFPRPHDYALLAELYREDGTLDAAEEVCRAGMRGFPNYGGLPYIMGVIAASRNDPERAKEHFGRAVALESHNYKALKGLAEVCLALGLADEARKHLEAILYFAPGDPAVQVLLKKIDAKAAAPATRAQRRKAMEATRIEMPPPRLAPRAAPRPAPAAVAAPAPVGAPATAEGRSTLDAAIHAFRAGVPGLEGAVLVDAFGLVVASDLEGVLPEDLTGALAANVWRNAAESAAPLRLGALREVEVEASESRLLVRALEESTLALLMERDTKPGLVEMKLRELGRALREGA